MLDELVSIYMPTHNRKDLAIRAIESVLNQTYKNIELIVVDDGSNDGTFDALIQIEDHRLSVFRNEIARGACYSRNLALSKCKGIYATGIDDDDVFEPERISVFMENFDPSYSFIFDSSKCIHGTYIEKLSDRVVTLPMILNQNIGNQVFTYLTRFIDVGLFDEKFPSSQDYDMWTRLIEKYGSAKQIPKITYSFDIGHGGSRITTSNKAISGAIMYIKKYKSHMNNENLANQVLRCSNYGKVPSLTDLNLVLKELGIKLCIKSMLVSIYVSAFKFVNRNTGV